MIPLRTIGPWTLAALALLAPAAGAEHRIEYPQTRRDDQVDVYHGVKVADPYRWLETDVRRSKEAADWVAAENKVTLAYLEAIPQRDAIRRRLTELWNYEKYSSPFKEGGRYFYFKNDGLQNQSVLYTMDALEGKARVLIDPNAWSRDGTVALAGLAVSWDGRYLAYGVAEAGSDWRTWRVMEIATGKVLADELKWVKFSGASWTHDGKGFFYSRFDEPKPVARFHALNLNQKLCYHRLGMPQSDDVLVYHRPGEPEWGYDGQVTEDGRYLVISVRKGTDRRNRVTVKDLAEPYGMPIDVIDDFDHEYSCVGNDGPVFYFKTDLDAPRKRLVSIDLRRGRQDGPRAVTQTHREPPGSSRRRAVRGDEPRGSAVSLAAPKQIIPQAEETLTRVSLVGNLFIASYLKDAATQVRIYTTGGRPVRDVKLPGIGTASGFGGRRTDTETFYSFSSFATPPTIYRYDVITGTSTLLRRSKVKFNPEEYEVKQVFYHSKDGTRVPMFIAHRKGIALDGNRPTLLYGYGGFAIPQTPRFSISRAAWMEMGGVFAVPNLRGGGEYGEAWHKAGTKLHKQNVFDDFVAAAEWLVANRYTRPERLGIQGGSNGGLLVGAVMTQRPNLFGACLPAVGVMDMLRFHKFTAGRYWVDDYGSSDNPEEFKALMAYSPCHNIKPGTAYPATLITTADTDDRVVPGHSFKFAAALQHAQAGPAPVLIRIETRAGHGAGKPTTKQIEEVADQWAFLVKNLGME